VSQKVPPRRVRRNGPRGGRLPVPGEADGAGGSSPDEVRAIRQRLGKTQAEFAVMIGVSLATLRNWEQGRRVPDGPARALLRVAAANPRGVGLPANHETSPTAGATGRVARQVPAGSRAPLRERLPGLLEALEGGLVERRLVLRVALLAALAGEHTLLIGPPGTAKSELARRLHLAFRDGRYFERLLTRYTVPEELFGPLSISALEQDRYERQTSGFLPQASIAFIDEVFKANSAILNALLTLLNEREFDNGAVREPCPLISVIGATNEVPANEVADAFFDRFLVRLPVGPVTADGFRRLLHLDACRVLAGLNAIEKVELEALSETAAAVRLPEEIGHLLAELRAWLVAERAYVSDRRWVKIVWLLKVAAASEGRTSVALWDLWLLPWSAAPDVERQAGVSGWLSDRLGIREGMSPPKLSRVVEAFEAQVVIEQDAEDLDYDDAGRLKFSTDLEGRVSDAKGAAQATRMTYTRKRRYGETHVGARVRQIDELLGRISEYAEEIAARRAELATFVAQSIWLDAGFARRADANLATTAEAIAVLKVRAERARSGFETLARLPVDPGTVPDPVEHEPLTP
jgi:MoxR-like ATPase